MRNDVCIARALSALAAAFLAASCTVSIWEVRDYCPSWLTFDLSGCEGQADSVTVILDDGGGPVTGTEFVFRSPYTPVEFEVERGDVSAVAFAGVDGMFRDGTTVMIPKGEQADSLFASHMTIDCGGEFATEEVRLHKQWVTLGVSVSGMAPTKAGSEGEPFRIEVRSDVAGLDMEGMKDISGEFLYSVDVPVGEQVQVNVFRHSTPDESLHMDIYLGDSLVGEVPLGREMAEAGLDWNAASLDDVEIDISMVSGTVSFKVVPWDDLGHDHIEF